MPLNLKQCAGAALGIIIYKLLDSRARHFNILRQAVDAHKFLRPAVYKLFIYRNRVRFKPFSALEAGAVVCHLFQVFDLTAENLTVMRLDLKVYNLGENTRVFLIYAIISAKTFSGRNGQTDIE